MATAPLSGKSASVDWQVKTPQPAGGTLKGPSTGLDLSLPAELEKSQKPPATLPSTDWKQQDRHYGRYNFDQQVEFNQEPMTKGEFVDNARQGLRDTFGENGAKGVETLAGAAYLASGGKLKLSRETKVFNLPAQVDFSASAKHGGTFGLGFKMQLGGP